MWEAIQRAFDMVDERLVTRIDGNGWTVYRVGEIVRIDVKDPQ